MIYLDPFSGIFIKEFMKAYKVSIFLMEQKCLINSVKYKKIFYNAASNNVLV